MKSEKVEFKGALGEKLSGRIDMPEGEIVSCALFAHCFTCSKNLRAVGNITKVLASKGIETLRFDFTGLGESEGDFADTNFSSNIDDLVAAAKFMNERRGGPAILIGHSLGGAAVLQAAHKLDSVKAVVTIGAPSEPKHVEKHFESKKEEIERDGEAVVKLAGRPFKVKKQFLDDLEKSRMDNYITNLNKALLVMHAPLDETVSIENAADIYKNAKHPKSFVSLHKADHLLTEEAYSLYAGSLIAEWFSIY
ncbi:MAG: alpha/beta hydrolase [Balneolaceae bacterium]|nr:MAG: alpha/beta hydrolase [Balneolaceae bacterium]